MIRKPSPAERARLFITIFTGFVMTIFAYLWIVGERRIDAYYVMYVLAYLVTLYTTLPSSVQSRWRVKITTIILIAIALGVIGWRIYQVIG